jgi:hypothetical protein
MASHGGMFSIFGKESMREPQNLQNKVLTNNQHKYMFGKNNK